MKNDDVVAALGAYMLLAMREAGESFVKVEYRRNAIAHVHAASSEVSIFADGDVVTIESDDPRTPEELNGLRPDGIVHLDDYARYRVLDTGDGYRVEDIGGRGFGLPLTEEYQGVIAEHIVADLRVMLRNWVGARTRDDLWLNSMDLHSRAEATLELIEDGAGLTRFLVYLTAFIKEYRAKKEQR